MPDALSEKVLARIAGAEALYHRLILVAAPSGAGKTEALRRSFLRARWRKPGAERAAG